MQKTTYRSRYEQAARHRKVAAITAQCRRHHFTARDIAERPTVRALVVDLAGVKEPSDETWRQVVAALIADGRSGIDTLAVA